MPVLSLNNLKDSVGIVAGSNVTVTNDAAKGSITIASSAGSSGNVISSTALGSEPGSPATGDANLPTNGVGAERWDGAAWGSFGPLMKWTKPPAVASWTQLNFGAGTTFTDMTNQAVKLWFGSDSSATNVRGAYVAMGGTTQLIAAFIPLIGGSASQFTGVFFRENSSGKIMTLAVNSTSIGYVVQRFTNATTFSSTAVSGTTAAPITMQPTWVKIKFNGANVEFWVGPDGDQWSLIFSEAKTAFFTTAPDQFGFGGQGATTTANKGGGGTLVSWATS